MKKILKLNTRGDTIVEVLLVLTILSLSFAISYATANAALKKSQNSQEHSQALGEMSSQADLFRSAVSKKSITSFPADSFCVYTDPITKNIVTAPIGDTPTYKVPEAAADDHLGNDADDPYPSQCKTGPDNRYHMSVTYVTSASKPAENYFQIRVRWTGLGNLGVQQEQMSYKVQALNGNGAGYGEGEGGPPIRGPVIDTFVGTPSAGPTLKFTWHVNPGDDPDITTTCQLTTKISGTTNRGDPYNCSPVPPQSVPYPATGNTGDEYTFVLKVKSFLGEDSKTYSWKWVYDRRWIDTSYDDPPTWDPNGGYWVPCWSADPWTGECWGHMSGAWIPGAHHSQGYWQDNSHWQYYPPT
jgi:type II secretory pathway pseudopilin PulG